MVGLAKTSIPTGGRDRVKPEDLFDIVQFNGQEAKTLRPASDIFVVATHWLEINTEKKGKVRLGMACRNVSLEGTDIKGNCAFCRIGHIARAGYYQNFYDTEEEANAPRNPGKPTPEEKKLGFKLKGTKLWTPARVMQFPPSVATTMQGITKKNKDKEGNVRELFDKNFGRALDIARDSRPGVAAANIWSVQKADEMMRKLTPVQREYWLWDLRLLTKLVLKEKELEAEMKKLVVMMTDEEFDKLDLSDYPELVAKRKGSKKKKSKSGSFSVDDDDEDDNKKNKRRIDDDDDDDDIPRRKRSRDDDDDDDDEPPRKKKKGKRKSFSMDDVF